MSNSIPLVSVIMNCFNGEAYLREAIDSVYNQTWKDWEIIFFDNASIDRSAKIAKSYDHRLRYFYNSTTITLGAARRAAVQQAKGKYLAFLDCDDLWLSTKLQKQLEKFNECHNSVALCYTNAIRVDRELKTIGAYSCCKKLFEGDIYYHLVDNCFIACSACMITRDVYDEVGGFDLNYRMVEELDLWLKIVKKYRATFVNEILTKIRVHDTNQSKFNFKTIQEYRHLLENLKINDEIAEAVCERKLQELRLRELFLRLYVPEKAEISKMISSFLKLFLYSVYHPTTSICFIKKYLNIRTMIYCFKKF